MISDRPDPIGGASSQLTLTSRWITLLSILGKVFARLILNRIRDHLILTQRPEQAGFTPKRSTIDWILGLRVLIQHRIEYREGFLAAYADFKKVFDSLDRANTQGPSAKTRNSYRNSLTNFGPLHQHWECYQEWRRRTSLLPDKIWSELGMCPLPNTF